MIGTARPWPGSLCALPVGLNTKIRAIGDLQDYQTYRAFVEGIEHFKRLFQITPQAVAHDLHPGYLSSQYARSLPDLPHVAVQHHHAHIASCMAENSCDRRGLGWDGCWQRRPPLGWEFLVATYDDFERLAQLAEVPLAGGEQAIRQPWRMAAAYLHAIYGETMDGRDVEFIHRLERRVWQVMRQMLARGINAPLTSSAGRLFDAIAALIGLRHPVQYEPQAAVELEMRADETPVEGYAFWLCKGKKPIVVETKGIIAGVVDALCGGEPTPRIAAMCQSTLAEIILTVCRHLRELTGLRRVALSGVVFQHSLFVSMVVSRLLAHGFEVYMHSRVPPNDGGICLRQAAVANAMLAKGR
jgi:hydrogenase maturation protein HypF